MKKYFEENWPLLLLTGVLLTLSVAAYVLSGREGQNSVEVRADSIAATLDRASAANISPDDRKHLIASMFLREQFETQREGLLLHLAIALLVASILVVGVDSIVRPMTRRELALQFVRQSDSIARSVWNAMLQRSIPEPLVRAMEAIVKTSVCRVGTRYMVTLSRPSYLPLGHVLVRRELSFKLWNTTSETTQHLISLRISEAGESLRMMDEKGAEILLPAIRAFRVAGEEVTIPENVNTIGHSISLPPMSSESEALLVFNCVEEVLKMTDRVLYVLQTPAIGLELIIVNLVPELVQVKQEAVFLSGPNFGRLRQDTPMTWTCREAILPGTVLGIFWSETTRP
jgi:hypothetical protein